MVVGIDHEDVPVPVHRYAFGRSKSSASVKMQVGILLMAHADVISFTALFIASAT
jgi:hypothetical protein